MLLGDVVNLFIGLCLTFALFGLLVSAVVEGLASLMDWRSKTMLKGLKDILNDQHLQGLARDILAHGAVNPRSPGPRVDIAAAGRAKRPIVPSYIPSMQFAGALIDVLQNPSSRPGSEIDLASAIASMPDAQLRGWLQGVYMRTAGDLNGFRAEVADWFDNAMDRVSGGYKRHTQAVSVIVAFILATIMNVDIFYLGNALWAHSAIISVSPEQVAKLTTPQDAYAMLTSFPVGWAEKDLAVISILHHIPGWIAVAVAALFGAPFWFDLLQRFVQLRGTGMAPSDKPKPAVAGSGSVVAVASAA
ncbi:MAG TPA: hypothetical protein VM689_23540 [Aliidongia sp.]|nr:hypothetical protein [Aliidongia sp.]